MALEGAGAWSAMQARMLDSLHRVFNKDPLPVLAFRLRYDGDAMAWAVRDGVLALTVAGGTGAGGAIDLRGHTLATLADSLAAQAGYTVLDENPAVGHLSALTLFGAGDPAASDGDHLYAFTNLLWAFLAAYAVELGAARDRIAAALAQMVLQTADLDWLQEHNTYYGIAWIPGEAPVDYANRTVAEVLQQRGNNVALESLILNATGMRCDVVDVGDGSIYWDGVESFDGDVPFSGYPAAYGLFDVIIPNIPSTPDQDAMLVATIRRIVDENRCAGFHVRQIGRVVAWNGSYSFDGAIAFDSVPA